MVHRTFIPTRSALPARSIRKSRRKIFARRFAIRRWSTKSIRPEENYTHRLKVEQIGEYGYSDSRLKDYEEDHFIPLELGGNPTDPKNLWPEPYETSVPDGGAHAKDKVENYLHAEVCSGSLTLDQARREISEDWYRVYQASVPH